MKKPRHVTLLFQVMENLLMDIWRYTLFTLSRTEHFGTYHHSLNTDSLLSVNGILQKKFGEFEWR